MQPVHMSGSRGQLTGVYFKPTVQRRGLGDVLIAPAFAEEMNRCRAMVALQARAFANIGVGTLVLDLFGTGDSAGTYSDATWEIWRQDMREGLNWLDHYGNGCTTLLGVRTGAILACELAAEVESVRNLIFWQPVIDGKTYFTQLLRVRIAAEINQVDGVRSTDELRKQAASGASIEVTGYEINPKLALTLDTIRLPDSSAIEGRRIGWFDVATSSDAPVPRAARATLDSYREKAASLTHGRVVGPAFWYVHERAVAPDLIRATSKMVDEWQQDRCMEEDAGTFANAKRHGLGAANGNASTKEQQCVFECRGDHLVGVLHRGNADRKHGVVVVVAGGPQYRVGAHRQFVSLARTLAKLGFPVLRFDLRGMGDSSGDHRGFRDSEPDIRAAIDELMSREPTVEQVVLFGECESATGILYYAHKDARVNGVILVNPWVRTEEGRAEVIIKHYYLERLRSREFWLKVLGGKFNPASSLRSFIDVVRAYLSRNGAAHSGKDAGVNDLAKLPLPVGTETGMRRFSGSAMILMSGNDYIAREFDELVNSSASWQELLRRDTVVRREVDGADHTFSMKAWHQEAVDLISRWLKSLEFSKRSPLRRE